MAPPDPLLPAAAVFDNDGLLLDTEATWSRAEVRLFEAHGSTFTMEHKRYLMGSSHDAAALKLEELLDRPGQGAALRDELVELVHEEARSEPAQPRPGAVARADLRTHMNVLTTSDFFSQKKRDNAVQKVKQAMGYRLEPEGIIVERLVFRDYKFERAGEPGSAPDRSYQQQIDETQAKIQEIEQEFRLAPGSAQVNIGNPEGAPVRGLDFVHGRVPVGCGHAWR